MHEIFKAIDRVFVSDKPDKLSKIHDLCDDARIFKTYEEWVGAGLRRPSRYKRDVCRSNGDTPRI